MPNFGNTINVSVTANPATGTLTVIGNNGTQLDVSQNALVQPIQWNLQLGAGQTGSFNPLGTDPATSGFSWTVTTAPRSTIFSGYAQPTSTQIQVNDMNSGSSDQGTWTYKLRATVNGTPCQTNPPNPQANPGDPMIKNKPN